MYTWKFTISLKFYTRSGPLRPRVPVDREFSSEMQKWDLVRTYSCLHCSWSVHLLTKVFKFKNIFLALSKSLLLAIATSLTPLSRLFHIFSTSLYWFSMGRRLPSNWDPNQWTCYSCQGFQDVCLQVCGSPFCIPDICHFFYTGKIFGE